MWKREMHYMVNGSLLSDGWVLHEYIIFWGSVINGPVYPVVGWLLCTQLSVIIQSNLFDVYPNVDINNGDQNSSRSNFPFLWSVGNKLEIWYRWQFLQLIWSALMCFKNDVAVVEIFWVCWLHILGNGGGLLMVFLGQVSLLQTCNWQVLLLVVVYNGFVKLLTVLAPVL